MFLFFLKIISKNFTEIFLSVGNVIPTVMSYENLSRLYKILCCPKVNKLKTTADKAKEGNFVF